jgi:hypothetical protein
MSLEAIFGAAGCSVARSPLAAIVCRMAGPSVIVTPGSSSRQGTPVLRPLPPAAGMAGYSAPDAVVPARTSTTCGAEEGGGSRHVALARRCSPPGNTMGPASPRTSTVKSSPDLISAMCGACDGPYGEPKRETEFQYCSSVVWNSRDAYLGAGEGRDVKLHFSVSKVCACAPIDKQTNKQKIQPVARPTAIRRLRSLPQATRLATPRR